MRQFASELRNIRDAGGGRPGVNSAGSGACGPLREERQRAYRKQDQSEALCASPRHRLRTWEGSRLLLERPVRKQASGGHGGVADGCSYTRVKEDMFRKRTPWHREFRA